MFHLPAMALALIATDVADQSAGQEDGSRFRRIKCRLAGDDISSGGADVGTIEVKTDAAQKRFALWFSKTGIGTGSTRLCTIKARLNTLRQQCAVYLWLGGTALQHRTSKTHCGFPFLFSFQAQALVHRAKGKRGTAHTKPNVGDHLLMSGCLLTRHSPLFLLHSARGAFIHPPMCAAYPVFYATHPIFIAWR